MSKGWVFSGTIMTPVLSDSVQYQLSSLVYAASNVWCGRSDGRKSGDGCRVHVPAHKLVRLAWSQLSLLPWGRVDTKTWPASGST